MKILILFFSICIISHAALAQQAEEDAIRQLIDQSYVQGIHNRAGMELISAGFHPGFEMLSINNGLLAKFPIYSWLHTIRKAMESGQQQQEPITAKIPFVDVAGTAAVARIELYRGEKHLFTDYMSLYKFEEGWKIVSKIYYRIPE
jgi:hypothetical protein